MELVHIIEGVVMSSYDAVSLSVMNLAARQAKAGQHTKVWFVADNPHQDYALANYEISLFPRLFNPLTLDYQLTEAIQCAKPNTVFHLHGEFTVFNYLVSSILAQANKPFVFTYFPAYNFTTTYQVKKQIQETLFKEKIIETASVLHYFAPEQMKQSNPKAKIIPYGFEVNQPMQQIRSSDKFICSYHISNCSNVFVFNILVKAFSYFLPQNPNTELWILGQSKYINSFEKIIKKHNIQNNIIFWNEQAPSERSKLISYSHLYLALSELAWPTTALEAAALGVPIIATNNTLLQQPIQEYEAGIILPSLNEVSLLEALNLLYGQINRQGVAVIGAQAQRMIRETYDWNKILPLYYQTYSNL